MVKVILNEQHSLMEQQKTLLDQIFGERKWDFLKVPSNGWSLEEQIKIANSLVGTVFEKSTIVFASPIPVLMARLSSLMGEQKALQIQGTKIFILHNDQREKKELPGGKIIQVVAKEGWQLVEI